MILRRIVGRLADRLAYRFAIRDWTRLHDLDAASRVLETKRFTRNIRPLEAPGLPDGPIVVVAPHPDDEVFGAGGVLVRAAGTGRALRVVYLTDGHDDVQASAAVRAEAAAVCSALGAEAVFLHHAPHAISATAEDLAAIRDAVLSPKPSTVVLPFLLDDHDDHRRTNEVLLRALGHGADFEVWAYQIYSSVLPNVVVDVTEVMARKLDLVRLYRSVRGNRDWAHFVQGRDAANCRHLTKRGQLYAEAFFVVPWSEYAALAETYFGGAERPYYFGTYRRREAP